MEGPSDSVSSVHTKVQTEDLLFELEKRRAIKVEQLRFTLVHKTKVVLYF